MTAARLFSHRQARNAASVTACGLLLATVACGSNFPAAPVTSAQPTAGTTTTPAAAPPVTSTLATASPAAAADTTLVRHEAPPHRLIRAGDLPAPFATASVNNQSRIEARPEGREIDRAARLYD